MRTIALLALTLLLGCAKDQFTPIADIPKLTDLGDVMDNQKAVADPLFAKVGHATFTDAEYAAMTIASERLLVTSQRTKELSKQNAKDPAAFEGFAGKLHDNAKALGAAAAAKDAAAAKAALTEMKATCKGCHSRFK